MHDCSKIYRVWPPARDANTTINRRSKQDSVDASKQDLTPEHRAGYPQPDHDPSTSLQTMPSTARATTPASAHAPPRPSHAHAPPSPRRLPNKAPHCAWFSVQPCGTWFRFRVTRGCTRTCRYRASSSPLALCGTPRLQGSGPAACSRPARRSCRGWWPAGAANRRASPAAASQTGPGTCREGGQVRKGQDRQGVEAGVWFVKLWMCAAVPCPRAIAVHTAQCVATCSPPAMREVKHPRSPLSLPPP